MEQEMAARPVDYIPQFDPREWIVAAGRLEKQRDGTIRDGWATRFFVLTESTLYYYRVSKRDPKGNLHSLLGDERGLIRIRNVEKVYRKPGEDEYWELRFDFKQGKLKRPIGSSTFRKPVESLVLRMKPERTCVAWESAINSIIDRQHRSISGEPEDMEGNAARMMRNPSVESNSSNRTTYQSLGYEEGSGMRDRNLPSYGQVESSYLSSDTNESRSPSHHFSEITRRRSGVPSSVQEQDTSTNVTFTAIEHLDNLPRPKLPGAQHLSFMDIGTVWALVNAMWFGDLIHSDIATLVLMNAVIIGCIVMVEQRARGHDVVVRLASEHFEAIESATSRLKASTTKSLPMGRVLSGSARKVPSAPPLLHVLESKKNSSNYVFTAGFGCMDGSQNVKWENGKAERFKTRIGPNYDKNKKKGVSNEAMYDTVAFDLIKSNKTKIKHIASKVELPKLRDGDDVEAIAKSGLPRIIVVNLQVPMNGSDASDPGISIVFYLAVKPTTVKQALNLESAPACVKLLHKFCNSWSTDDDIRRRFKGMAIADNMDELGFAIKTMFGRFNGKPVIIYKSAEIFEGDGYLEIDVKIHEFNTMCRTAITKMRDKVPALKIQGGFCIQAEPDEEMPENILGCFQLTELDFEQAKLVEGI